MKLTTILLLGAALAAPAFAADNTAAPAPNQSGTHAPQVDGHQNAGTDAAAQAAPAQTAMTDSSKPGRSADDANATAGTQTAANTSTPMPATNAETSSNTASNGKMSGDQAAMNSSANGKMAMTDGSADTSPLSSIPDTQKKYKRSARAKDFQKEAETTKKLNSQVASAGGLPKVQ